jgi:hypothetical protein
MDEAAEATLAVIRVLDALDIPYAIGGSLAGAVYGVARATVDAVIVADLGIEHMQPFVAALSDSFYLSEAAMLDAIERQSSFNLIHLQTMFKVDIFIPKQRWFEQSQFANRRLRELAPGSGVQAYFSSPEDTILAKLEWYRLGGGVSDRQWQDVLTIVRVQKERLDYAYLARGAAELDVVDLWDRLSAEK